MAPVGRKCAKKVGDAFGPERAPQKSEGASGWDFLSDPLTNDCGGAVARARIFV